jgi:galactokinase
VSTPLQHLPAGEPEQIASRLAADLDARHPTEAAAATALPPVAVHAAPGRVNLIGEHVDYNGGRCLPLTLPHACFVASAPRPGDTTGEITLASRQADQTWRGRPADAGPGALDGWTGYAAGVLWALEQDGFELPGMDLLVDGRVPLGSGLSSSAALGCSVALAALGAAGHDVGADDLELRHRLVRACVRAENEVVGAPTGGLDQAASLLAAPGSALLIDLGAHTDRRVAWHPEEAGLVLLVVDTRVEHGLAGSEYGVRRQQCEEAVSRLGLEHLALASRGDVDRLDDEVLRRRTAHVVSELERVDRVVAALERGRIADIGPDLTASHVSLRDDYEVSCPELDAVVEAALEGGALGARMTGGGFGGSALALVPRERADAVESRVAEAFESAGWRAPALVEVGPAQAAGRVR